MHFPKMPTATRALLTTDRCDHGVRHEENGHHVLLRKYLNKSFSLC
ncbi:Uncharacterized protein FWK35_00033352 [Aphis craccivora]|uniref:Uncharacterized protein n=1 Tax=Aphis craccivora TaxID=307492 RepID=A0A6G0YUQ5_APHCR|nr:Uncharacterized protein FWK35_00033352 [Aphis craccivora]